MHGWLGSSHRRGLSPLMPQASVRSLILPCLNPSSLSARQHSVSVFYLKTWLDFKTPNFSDLAQCGPALSCGGGSCCAMAGDCLSHKSTHKITVGFGVHDKAQQKASTRVCFSAPMLMNGTEHWCCQLFCPREVVHLS